MVVSRTACDGSWRWPYPSGPVMTGPYSLFQAPDVQDAGGRVVSRGAFGEGDHAVDDDGAVPVAGAGGEGCDLAAGGRIIDPEAVAVGVVDIEEAACDHGAGAAVVVLPERVECAAVDGPCAGAVVVGHEHGGA